MSAETDREALALYPFDGSDPNLIIALHTAFRAGAEFATEHTPAPIVTARCPWADCHHGERCVHAKEPDDREALARAVAHDGPGHPYGDAAYCGGCLAEQETSDE